MKNFFNDPFSYLLMYVIAGVFTFGHAFHQTPNIEVREFAGQTYTVENGVGIKALGGMFSAAFWPLYWSVQAQKKN